MPFRTCPSYTLTLSPSIPTKGALALDLLSSHAALRANPALLSQLSLGRVSPRALLAWHTAAGDGCPDGSAGGASGRRRQQRGGLELQLDGEGGGSWLLFELLWRDFFALVNARLSVAPNANHRQPTLGFAA